MVYTFKAVEWYPNMLMVETDKPHCTWDVTECPDLYIGECEAGLRAVEHGAKKMLGDDNFGSFHFDTFECGIAMGENEWMLLGLVLLKQNGCISLESKAVFSWGRQHNPNDIGEGGSGLVDDCIIFLKIANEETNMYYQLEEGDGSGSIDKKTGERITVQDMERRGNDWARKSPGEISCTTVRMDVVDFGSMFARCEVLRKERKGRDTLGRVLAVLMGTHRRLGGESVIGGLDIGVVGMIVFNVLPVALREAVEAGVVRF